MSRLIAGFRIHESAVAWMAMAGVVASCGRGSAPTGSAVASLREEQQAKWSATEYLPEPDRKRAGDVIAKKGDFKVYPNTRFCSLGFVDPELEVVFQPADPTNRYKARVGIGGGPDTAALEKYGFDWSTAEGVGRYTGIDVADERRMRDWPKECPQDNINILFTQHIGLNDAGRPYRITLTARQGKRFWSRSIERPSYLRPEIGPEPGGKLDVPGQTWDPDLDVQELRKQFQIFLLE